ncbi:unnamed protein product [Leuciscus chuanchicus]
MPHTDSEEDMIRGMTVGIITVVGDVTDPIPCNSSDVALVIEEAVALRGRGGVLRLGCTHGVVYYHSPLWWLESARDHGDALLCFKSPPSVFISDIADTSIIGLIKNVPSHMMAASAEQISKEMSTSRYFLCQLKDIHYMFALLLYFHLYNERINNTFLEDIKKKSPTQMCT